MGATTPLRCRRRNTRSQSGVPSAGLVPSPLMGELIDLEHVRRGQRLFAIFVQRFGIEHFLAADTGQIPRLDPDRLEQAVELACGWLERRAGRQINPGMRTMLRKRLRRRLLQSLAERMVAGGF